MAQTIQEERLRWIRPILNKDISLQNIARICPYSKRSLERWISQYRRYGISGLVPHTTRPKHHPRETPIQLKERIIQLRKDTYEDCAVKIAWELQSQGIRIHERTVGKILKTEGLVRTYKTRRMKYTYVRAQEQVGDMVEIDVKELPPSFMGRKQYQFTAIDRASRWRYLRIYEEAINSSSILFLEELQKRAPFPLRAIKTDNGSIFTNYYTSTTKRSDNTVKTLHALDRYCSTHGILHYLIDPGKPAQNGRVERSHKTDDDKCYSSLILPTKTKEELDYHVALWNMYYNDQRHCSLKGKTPNEYIAQYMLQTIYQKPPYDCT
jgi:transposase InsO family protein